MIRTSYGILIEQKDLKALAENDKYYIPLSDKNRLSELNDYYEEVNKDNEKSIILLKTGSVLENLYLCALDKKIFVEHKFNFKPRTIIIWDEYIRDEVRKR